MREFAAIWFERLKHVLLQLFIVLDQAANVIVSLPFPGAWRGAWADETLSCRAYRADQDGKAFGRFWRPVIDAMFFWQKQPAGVSGHCHGAYEKERAGYNFPAGMR